MKANSFVHTLIHPIHIPLNEGEQVIDAITCFPPNYHQALTLMTLEQIGSKYRENLRRSTMKMLTAETVDLYKQIAQMSSDEAGESDPFTSEIKKAVDKKKKEKEAEVTKDETTYLTPDDTESFNEIKHNLYAYLTKEELELLHAEFLKLLQGAKTNKLFKVSAQDDAGLSDAAVRLLSMEDRFMLMVKYLYFFTHFSP